MTRETKGIIYTLIGGTLWGASGMFGGYLFMHKGITANWLVPHRLLMSGILLLMYLYKKDRLTFFQVWKDREYSIKMLIFGIFGMLACQYTYYKTIEYSNPGIATVLQYFGPTLILLYTCMMDRRLPKKYEATALILSIIGVFILATHGNINSLQIPLIALTWGMVAALSLVIYTVQPVKMIEKYGTTYVIAWGMLIGGIVLYCFLRPWNEPGQYDFTTFFMFMIIVIFGTILSFLLYLNGVFMLGPTKASMIACIEPVSATFFSTVFLGTAFTFLDAIGFVLVMSTVFIVAYFGNKK